MRTILEPQRLSRTRLGCLVALYAKNTASVFGSGTFRRHAIARLTTFTKSPKEKKNIALLTSRDPKVHAELNRVYLPDCRSPGSLENGSRYLNKYPEYEKEKSSPVHAFQSTATP